MVVQQKEAYGHFQQSSTTTNEIEAGVRAAMWPLRAACFSTRGRRGKSKASDTARLFEHSLALVLKMHFPEHPRLSKTGGGQCMSELTRDAQACLWIARSRKASTNKI